MSSEFSKKEIYPSPKNAFKFFLEPIENIKDDALILLDANVLLLPYTTDVKNVEAIKSVYQQLVSSEQIYIPSQATREYLDNRATKLSDINEALNKKATQSFNYVGEHPLLASLDSYKKVLELEPQLKKAIKEYQAQIRETLDSVQKWGWNDPVSKMYHEVLSERVLDDTEMDIDKISEDLERRNRLKIPPGYKDGNKKSNQAGDLLIWHELLDFASSQNKHVIFVSGDEKADWWHQSGKNPLYPRFELVDEFRERTEGKSFHMISLSTLLKIYEVNDEVVESIKASEAELRLQKDSELAGYALKKGESFDPDGEYRKYLEIPDEHGLIVSHKEWRVKGGYDTDTYHIKEINKEYETENVYELYDSTKTSPPFTREIFAKKL